MKTHPLTFAEFDAVGLAPGRHCSVADESDAIGEKGKVEEPMHGNSYGPKEKLIRILQGVLETDIDLSFLMSLKKSEIETLVACVRNRVDNPPK